jgi:4-hydroxy-tetrahydrodipicolinate synthase
MRFRSDPATIRGSIAPAAVAQLYEHWMAGEHDKARDLHYGLHPLVDLIFADTNPAPAKWVLEQAGLLRSGYVRPPLTGLSAATQARVRQLLAEGGPVLGPPVRRLVG